VREKLLPMVDEHDSEREVHEEEEKKKNKPHD
jgi:hypothetical protein